MAFGAMLHRFEPAGWLEREHPTGHRLARPRVRATVEIRGDASPERHQALIGGSFAADDGPVLRVRIAHSGPWDLMPKIPCSGLRGRPLRLGLPEEFATGVQTTLTSDPHGLHAGCITVCAGAYDETCSSQVSFSLATELLRWILLAADPETLTADQLAARWGRLGW